MKKNFIRGDTILKGYTKSDQKCINQTVNEHRWNRRVQLLDTDKNNFAFINGSIINNGKKYSFNR